ncbi:MAG: EpsG family protein [Ginsengibacter sp.]
MLIYYIYFIFLAVVAVEYEINPFKSNGVLIFIILSLALLAGLRSEDVSRDYLAYQYGFDDLHNFIGDPPWSNFIKYEPGFIAVVLFFKQFFLENYGLAIMLFFAFASVTIKVLIVDRFSINPYLVILLYFSHYFMLHEMTQIRIGFASAIFFISLIFYFKNNYKAFICLVLLAALFHYSAICYLALLLFDKKTFNRYIYVGLIILSIAFAFIKLPLFNFVGNLFSTVDSSGKLATYSVIIENKLVEDIKVFNVINLLKIFCAVYLIYVVPKDQLLKDKQLLFFLKCTILSIFTLSLFSGVPSVAFRISELFGVMSMFIFAYMAKYLPFYKYNVWFVVIIAGLLFYFSSIHGGLLNPYQLIKIR